MRTINWRHFAPPSCASCQHPSNVEAGALCSEHGAQAEAFVEGFKAAAKLAVYAASSYLGFVALAPNGRIMKSEGWGSLINRDGGDFLCFPNTHAAQEAANSLPWWPLQLWEVEA